ncbi:acyltransferase family protein [Flavobacteriaceae sp. LMIT009]
MRRYDLDWLRVIVFALLIFYHVGMFFVPWGWHIKNNVIYEWLRIPMWFLNQWRLPILFIISGMGTYYALNKRSGLQFTIERIKRLLVPLVFGMLIIVPPQVYIERIAKSQFLESYFSFWPSQAFIGVYPEGNLSWHHLWFLPYLLLFSLVLIPLFLFLRNNPNHISIKWLSKQIKSPFKIYLFIIPLYLAEAFLEPFFPTTHALIGDWFTIINYILMFLFGFLLITVKDTFWNTVESYRKRFLVTGILLFTAMVWLVYNVPDSTVRHFTEALIKVANLWSWILVLFGFASKYFNTKSRTLSYCNQAVYPFYILHQTVTIIIAYYLMNLEWSLFVKSSILAIGTFGISWILYEFLIRRVKFLRPLFGLKKKTY